ncbi:MAG: ABC transporter ATP-binding protein [Candidatus Saganbacteria bacterium]|nr:ABC transporter ATP-binding protein [Candidatus Saganbacteria bacterium]
MVSPLIEIEHLVKQFGAVTAVNDVSLSIRQGESLGLVGESGSGKTTLARMVIRLIEPTSGKINYPGVSDIRRECQIVFQDPQTSLNPRIKVGEAIGEPLLIHALLPKSAIPLRVKELLDMVKLPAEYAGRYPHELSGGERQRIGIARALASRPKFLILDEPVSALDVSIQVDVLRLLRSLRDELKLTYLFIAHDLSVIGFICDRVAVMKQGELLELADKAELFAAPKMPYTRKLLASTLAF